MANEAMVAKSALASDQFDEAGDELFQVGTTVSRELASSVRIKEKLRERMQQLNVTARPRLATDGDKIRSSLAAAQFRANKPEHAVEMSVMCDLSDISLADAHRAVGVANVYRLIVNPCQRRLAGELIGKIYSSPMAPTVGLEFNEALRGDEWILHGDERCVWCPGC